MIGSSGIQRLRSRFRGELLTSDDAGFDAARRVFNGAIDRRPALIARCQFLHIAGFDFTKYRL
jgi:hypothetical protein